MARIDEYGPYNFASADGSARRRRFAVCTRAWDAGAHPHGGSARPVVTTAPMSSSGPSSVTETRYSREHITGVPEQQEVIVCPLGIFGKLSFRMTHAPHRWLVTVFECLKQWHSCNQQHPMRSLGIRCRMSVGHTTDGVLRPPCLLYTMAKSSLREFQYLDLKERIVALNCSWYMADSLLVLRLG